MDRILIRGARQHNLQNLSLEIPRQRLTVVTGLSGSGKSSLAFDTLYAEGQRRYVATLSAYARQFLDQMEHPEVDSIEGLSPAIAIEQKTTAGSPRSTVGTVTEIYDYLRLLWASIGTPHCPNCRRPIRKQSLESMTEQVLGLGRGAGAEADPVRLTIFAPVVRGRKGVFKKELAQWSRSGFTRIRVDGELRSLDDEIVLNLRQAHTLEIAVDRLALRPGVEARLRGSLQTALRLADGLALIAVGGQKEELLFSEKLACPECGASLPALEPRSFSFNSSYGACPRCRGLGYEFEMDPDKVIADWSKPLEKGGLAPALLTGGLHARLAEAAARHGLDLKRPPGEWTRAQQNWLLYGQADEPRTAGRKKAGPRAATAVAESGFTGLRRWFQAQMEEASDDFERDLWLRYASAAPCQSCEGQRLRPESLAVSLGGKSIAEATALPLDRARQFFQRLTLNDREGQIAGKLLEEVDRRLGFLLDLGLGYLSLDRSAGTLSGGEAQRIRLAGQIGSQLRGVLYVLDEPSIGLHARDNQRLLASLEKLRDLGNTLVVVEHDRETIERADKVLDLGPGAGAQGGRLMAEGTPQEIARAPGSLTGAYLSGRRQIPLPAERRLPAAEWLRLHGAREHNLKNLTAAFPLGRLIVVTGVSGSGKSTLINDLLYPALARHLYHSPRPTGRMDRLEGAERLDKAIRIDQAPIGRTPRSNPATYTGLFTPIRELFAMLPEARMRGYTPGRFSFNLPGGRCEACRGEGERRIEMNFLPDARVPCDVCRGRRYNQETLAVRFKGLSIADVLDATVEEMLAPLRDLPRMHGKLETLMEVGLGYLRLGQPAVTLSGGEAQRIKLARELSRRQTGRTVYLLDEPTTGLHFEDVRHLIALLDRLVALGNTVIVIEHNLDVIKSADWVLDLGPEGGEAGGEIVAAGPPEMIAACAASHTGKVLRAELKM